MATLTTIISLLIAFAIGITGVVFFGAMSVEEIRELMEEHHHKLHIR